VGPEEIGVPEFALRLISRDLHDQFIIGSRAEAYVLRCRTLLRSQRNAQRSFIGEVLVMKPYVGAIEKLALKNENFRQVLFTGTHEQLVLMCLNPKEEIGNEMHADVDQFFRIEEGEAMFVFGGKEKHQVHAGEGVVVPAGTFHNVINASPTKPLKLYTLYSPPQHPAGTVQKTRPQPEVAAHH
jgi:mannose-6-phosphate isomerase-like protein (cupin superfamily)